MRSHQRIPVVLAVLALAGCGRVAPHALVERAQPVRPVPVAVPTPRAWAANPVGAASLALAVRAGEQRVWLVTLEAAQARQSVPVRRSVPLAVLVAMDTVAVRQCIKDHESGNYAEASNPGGASGAYQYEPATWRTWSERAGYPGYAYAYQAPPNVQDAVTDYTLTHGGAGNWSPRYGADPCTVGYGG